MIEFFVPGRVAPQGSKRYVGGNKASGGRFIEASKYLPAWRTAVTTVARDHMTHYGYESISGPVDLNVVFYIERPKSIPQSKRVTPIVPPDVDKLVRAICDAMTDAGVWDDDAQVIHLKAMKLYDDHHEPGAHIIVDALDTPTHDLLL